MGAISPHHYVRVLSPSYLGEFLLLILVVIILGFTGGFPNIPPRVTQPPFKVLVA